MIASISRPGLGLRMTKLLSHVSFFLENCRVAARIDRAGGMTENVEKAMKLMSVLIQRTKNTPPMELTVDKLFKY